MHLALGGVIIKAKITFAALLIFVLLTLSCVSATDMNQTEDNVALNDENTDEILSESTDETLANSTVAVGTFTDLEREINSTQSDIIELNRDYTYNNDTDYKFINEFVKGIKITDKNITIDGKGHTLNGAHQTPMFYVTGKSITLKNIIFKNGDGDWYGGAVGTKTFITILNCTFINNQGRAGAVNAHSTGGLIKDCTFIGNQKFEEEQTHSVGALDLDYGTVINCTFKNNRGYTGALHLYEGRVFDCIFENNTAEFSGGAIYVTRDLEVTNSIFVNNKAWNLAWALGTGAIAGYVPKAKWSLINSTFINNTDNGWDQETSLDYHVNHLDEAKAKNRFYFANCGEIINCTFVNTSLRIDDGLSTVNKLLNVTLKNNNFIKSTLNNTEGNLTLSGNKFDTGYIENHARIISDVYLEVPNYVQHSTGTMILARMTDDSGNSIRNDLNISEYFTILVNGYELNSYNYEKINGNWYYQIAKDLENGNYTVLIELKNKTEFEKFYKKYSVESGLLRVDDIGNYTELENDLASPGSVKTLERDYALFITSEFGYENGILIDEDNIIIDGKGHTISGSEVARIFNITGRNVTLKNITFADGYSYYGGAVISSNDITLEDCKFINNHAIEGGAAYLNDASIKDCKFIENYASVNGGALYTNSANITNTQFNYNIALEDGGALYISSGNITNSVFTNKTAEKGVISVKNLLNITDTVLENNTITLEGTDILLKEDGEVLLNNVTPKDLKAKHIVELKINPIADGYSPYNVTVTVQATSEGKALTTGYLLISIDNANYTAEVKNGIGELPLYNLLNGTHNIKVTYNGGDKYTTPVETTSFKVNKQYLILEAGNANYNIDNGGKYEVKVRLYSQLMPDVKVNLVLNNEGVIIASAYTDYMGVARFNLTSDMLKNIGTGSYELVSFVEENEYFLPSGILAKLTIAKATPQLTASGASCVINYAKEYSTTLKDSKGNALAGQKVTFTLNGKNIGSATTDANGVATITLTAKILKAAKSGTKNLVIKFNGNKNYNAVTKTVKVKINKEKTKITAKKKTFKKSAKTKKYTITLKNSKGKAIKKVKVTIKIKGKTYKAKTNSKGKATFKITKPTKKGTFKAKVTYKGNAYFKKATKTVKIKIK